MPKKVVIIGGGASGMVLATQLIKKSNNFDVYVFEKSKYIGWAGCPTPYYIGGELKESSFNSVTLESIRARGINAYTESEVYDIDFKAKNIKVKSALLNDNTISYDELVLSMGAKPFIPENMQYLKKFSNVFNLTHASDAFAIKKFLNENKLQNAVIVGGGFVGIEMAEAFANNGLKVNIVEKQESLLSNLNQDLIKPIYQEFLKRDINLHFNTVIESIKDDGEKISSIKLENGVEIKADIVLLSLGIVPNLDLFKERAEINIDKSILVNEFLQTNISNVWAAGDLVFSKHLLTEKLFYAPFGDVADKHALALASTLTGKSKAFKGLLGSYALSFYDVKIAHTGLSLKQAQREGFDALSMIFAAHTRISSFGPSAGNIEIIYERGTNKILGATMIGNEAASQFIDQISILITFKLTLEDAFDVDYAYSPTNASVWNPLLLAARKVL